MFFRRRENNPSPSWTKWILVLFVIYALIAHNQPNTKNNPNKVRQAVENTTQHISEINFSDYTERMFPQYVAALRISDVEVGMGLPVICGQEVALAYDTFLPDGTAFDDKATKDKPLRFTIGAHQVMPVFEEGIIGMQKGGKRSLIAPPNMAYGKEGFKREGAPVRGLLRFEVTLVDLSPAMPDPDTMPYRIAVTRNGMGSPKLCGDDIKVRVEIWDINGKKLYSTKEGKAEPLRFTPGKSQVFLGLEQGVIGMTQGENRTLIVPPAFQKTLRNEKPEIEIPFPKNQTIIVDVESVP